MKKYFKTTLGRKLLAFYLVFFAIVFYAMSTLGHTYIRTRVYEEAQGLLKDIGIALLSTHFNQKHYTKNSVLTLQSQLNAAAEAAECRILIICNDGDIVIDTDKDKANYNVYQGNSQFLHNQATENFTMDGYLSDESLFVCLPLEENAFFNGYLALSQTNNLIEKRTEYYTNIFSTFFFLIMFLVGIVFILVYIFNFFPLRKIRKAAIQFSISHENPPIDIHRNDEYGELAQTLNVIGAELSKFDEYQRKFISNISHDFRSPLTNIRGYVQAMRDGTIPVERQEKYLNIILLETERLTKLTNNLLDLNHYDRDNIFLDIISFDIHKAIQMVIDSMEDSRRSKNISIHFEPISTKKMDVRADKDKIVQVLHNLLDNALKFSEANSEVVVSASEKRGYVFISVKDNGIGIPKEDQTKIWDRFYKTDLSRGRDKLGTGLGLPICKEIINAHKQTITVVSTVGVGSKFTFTLPKA